MARAGGTAGGGMGGGPDSAPGGSSASGPGTDGPGNAPGEGMDAGAFGGGGGVESAREKSAQAFREAIARAMGVTAATPSPMSPEKSAAQAAQESRDPAYRDAAVEAQVMGSSTDDADAIASVMDSKGAFATQDDDPVGISMAGMRGMEGALTGATTLDDPQGTEEGLNQAQVAADTLGARSSRPSAHPSRDTRIGMPFGVGRPALTDQKQNIELVDQYGRVALIEKKFETDPVAKKAAYDKLREYAKANIERGTALGKAIESALSFLGPMSMMNNIGKVMDLAMTKAGFTTDSQLNAIGLAIRDAQEVSTQGPKGAGGTSVGSINDGRYISMLESGQLDYVEPWMKGLSDQQIQYYFDRPSELEWVRTTWSKAFGLPSKYNN